MANKQDDAAPAPAPEPTPQAGGSYTRLPDGTLQRNPTDAPTPTEQTPE